MYFAVEPKNRIEGLEFREQVYRISLENGVVTVYRLDGAILLMKGHISPESVDQFEVRLNEDELAEIYLHWRDNQGKCEDFCGYTNDRKAAEAWVDVVNQIYANRRDNQSLVEAAD
jgi:hypothetical protein